MIHSVWELNRILVEVDGSIKPEMVKDIVEAEIKGSQVEKVYTMDRFRRDVVLGAGTNPAVDVRTGPFFSANKVYLIVYRLDATRKFAGTIKKIEKEAADKQKAIEKAKEEAAAKKKAEDIAEAEARLRELKGEPELENDAEPEPGTGAETEDEKEKRIEDSL